MRVLPPEFQRSDLDPSSTWRLCTVHAHPRKTELFSSVHALFAVDAF